MALTAKMAEIKNQDMEEEVAQALIQLCVDTMLKDPVESRMAPLIKREMDKLYSPTWHVFIGKDFGANVTHENKSFISFILGPLSFLVFKSG